MAQLTMKKCWNCNSEVVITSVQCPFCKERLGLVGKDGVAAKRAVPTGPEAMLESIAPTTEKKLFLAACGCGGILFVLVMAMYLVLSHESEKWDKEAAAAAQVAEVEKEKAATAKRAELARIEAAKTPEQRAAEAKARAAAQKAAAIAAEAQRRAAAAHAQDEITIPMGFPDNYSVGLSMVTLKSQMFNQLKALQESGRLGTTSGVTFEVTAKMTDKYGNSNVDSLMTMRFQGDDLRRVNWENMDDWKVMGLCHAFARTKEAEGILIEFSQTSTMRAFAPGFARQIR